MTIFNWGNIFNQAQSILSFSTIVIILQNLLFSANNTFVITICAIAETQRNRCLLPDVKSTATVCEIHRCSFKHNRFVYNLWVTASNDNKSATWETTHHEAHMGNRGWKCIQHVNTDRDKLCCFPVTNFIKMKFHISNYKCKRDRFAFSAFWRTIWTAASTLTAILDVLISGFLDFTEADQICLIHFQLYRHLHLKGVIAFVNVTLRNQVEADTK